MGATTAHRTPERVADETCTQVWAWMTNKCRERMNQKNGYIISEISQEGGGGRRLLRGERSWEFTFSDEESFLPRT